MTPSHKVYGLSLAALAALTSAIMMGLVRDARLLFTPSEVVFYRCTVMSLVCLPFAVKEIRSLWSKEAIPVWIRCTIGGANILLLYFALQQSQISLVSALFGLTPIFIVFVSSLVIGEKTTTAQRIGCVLAAIGAFLLVTSSQAMGALVFGVGLLSCFLRACAFTALRRATARHSAPTIVFLLSLLAMASSLALQPDLGKLQAHWNHPDLLGIAVTALATQLLLTLSLRYINTASVGVVEQSEILWAALIGIIWHSYHPSMGEWSAFATIMTSCLLVSLRWSRR